MFTRKKAFITPFFPPESLWVWHNFKMQQTDYVLFRLHCIDLLFAKYFLSGFSSFLEIK